MKVAAKNVNAKFFACELWIQRVGTFGVVLYRNQRPQNFILLSYVLHIGSSIRYENVLNGNYFLICYIVKRILISFNCFSEYKYMVDNEGLLSVCFFKSCPIIFFYKILSQ